MRISLLCSDESHPVNNYLQNWVAKNKSIHQIEVVHRKADLSGGDVLFLVSCAEIISRIDRSAYRSALVLHASDLPLGRGWSPHVWQIIEGASEITVSLLEAEDNVDSGRIWKKLKLSVPKHALWDEINHTIFEAEINLIDFVINNFGQIKPVEQDNGVGPTFYPRRVPADSQIDPMQSIVDQFDKIRVCDPKRFPAFFELYGKRYKLSVEKFDE